MKNHSKFNSKTVCFLIILCICSCGDQNTNNEEDTKEITAPSQIINLVEAKADYDMYSKRRVPLIQQYEDSINKQNNDDQKFDVGRFVYYDYKTIKQYLAFIEQEAKEANVEISTLRFYFSNYPDQDFFPGSKDSIIHPRQNSIMLSPTYNDGKRDYLFYVDRGAEGQVAIPLADNFEAVKEYGNLDSTSNKVQASFVPNFKKSKTNLKTFQNGQSLTLNRGTGVPPPKNQ
ncbi:hypothetical protein ACNR9Q_07880 [Maribacter sp. X9]|uniref:hypothetical protein n=1 Tax=Maribacter sp. X9 TaxID=3402159 RepID=UPI003AF3C9B1